jgi:hypothetical protein
MSRLDILANDRASDIFGKMSGVAFGDRHCPRLLSGTSMFDRIKLRVRFARLSVGLASAHTKLEIFL